LGKHNYATGTVRKSLKHFATLLATTYFDATWPGSRFGACSPQGKPAGCVPRPNRVRMGSGSCSRRGWNRSGAGREPARDGAATLREGGAAGSEDRTAPGGTRWRPRGARLAPAGVPPSARQCPRRITGALLFAAKTIRSFDTASLDGPGLGISLLVGFLNFSLDTSAAVYRIAVVPCPLTDLGRVLIPSAGNLGTRGSSA